MEKLPLCRICLVQNVRMFVVVNSNLRELYEKLTDIPFVTEDNRPILACFFCCAKLKQCYRFLRQCLVAEELFAQMMNEDYETNPLINQDRLEFHGGFIKSPTENISIVDECETERITFKEELPAACERLDYIIEPKEEHQSDELEPENLDNSCLDVADISPHHPELDLNDDVSPIEFKTEVEEEQEVSKKKPRARETKISHLPSSSLGPRACGKPPRPFRPSPTLDEYMFIKPSPNRIPCPLIPGTPTTPPPKKRRHWEMEEGPSTSTDRVGVDYDRPLRACSPSTSEAERVLIVVPPTITEHACSPSTSEAAEPVPFVAPVLHSYSQKGKGKAPPTKLLFAPSSGVCTVDAPTLDDSFHVVDAKFDYIGFTPTSSPGPARLAVGPCPTASTSSVTNEPSVFDDVEDDIASWERSIVEIDIGSDVEEDLPDMEGGLDFRPCQRFAEEFSTELEDLAPMLQNQLATLDAHDDSALRNFVSSEGMLTFNWTSDASAFSGEREVFTGLSGPTFETDGMTPLDIFERIWDETIINLIVAETNRYADHLFENPNLLRHSRIKKWKTISTPDLWTFFGIMMLQSFVPNPVEKDYWHPRFPYLRIGNFKDFMTYGKFFLIKKCLHFVDNSTIPASNSKLAKISPIIDHLNRKFSSLYLPEQNIAIDESLLLWKGRLSFAQLIANKAARVGIKSYELCESRTGYLWKFEIYAGKGHLSQFAEEHEVEKESNEPEGATSQIVYRLVRPLLNKGHTLVMDNFYNSPLLSRTLKAQKTDTIGTLRLNREFIPDSLRSKTKNNMRPGEIVFSHTEDLSLVVWRDSNLVSLISTYHKVEVSGAEKHGLYKYKPQVVLDYNVSMGGVDKKDQLLQAFPVERIRNMVWYKKLFRRLLNVSIHNAYVIYSHKKKILHRAFRMTLADQILRKHCPPRLTPAQMPAYGHFPVKGTGKARCKQCAKTHQVSRTTWACDTCEARLCITCFKAYHTS